MKEKKAETCERFARLKNRHTRDSNEPQVKDFIAAQAKEISSRRSKEPLTGVNLPGIIIAA